MKYIMFKHKLAGDIEQKVPIIFPNHLVHAEVARAMREVFKRQFDTEPEIASAGEINLTGCLDVDSCFGKSETLKKESHKDDAAIINLYDYLHGIE